VLDWATSWPRSPPARHNELKAPARYNEPMILLGSSTQLPPTCSYKLGRVLLKIYSLPRITGQLITG
ncbi:hypothetical protein A2U01_0105195, partial [Trifolium medium]|nr:hypothetical protein [Trifolium medium]